jgi:hypothetical protein
MDEVEGHVFRSDVNSGLMIVVSLNISHMLRAKAKPESFGWETISIFIT